MINGGFEHLDQALKSNNTIVRFLNHYATTSATESPVPVTTNDLFETRGRLDATLVRVEDAIDSAAEVAAAGECFENADFCLLFGVFVLWRGTTS